MSKLKEAAKDIIKNIQIFDAGCNDAQYTDPGHVWELLNAIEDQLTEALGNECKGCHRPIPTGASYCSRCYF